MKRIILLLAIIVTGMTQELQAQKAAIKTNLLSDACLLYTSDAADEQ